MHVPCGETTLAEAVERATEWFPLFKPSWPPSWLSANQPLNMGVRKVFPIASALLTAFSGASSQTTGRMLNLILDRLMDIDVHLSFASCSKEILESPFGYNQGLRVVA